MIAPVPLTRAAYARFGDVIDAPADTAEALAANQGSALKFHHLAALDNLRPAEARLDVSVFRCRPRAPWPFPLALVERHPASTQIFIPMNAARYLVVVAGTRPDGGPDLDGLIAFVAHGAQGVTYRPGTWHHPMIAIDRETDFVCFVHDAGTPADCEEHGITAPIVIAHP